MESEMSSSRTPPSPSSWDDSRLTPDPRGSPCGLFFYYKNRQLHCANQVGLKMILFNQRCAAALLCVFRGKAMCTPFDGLPHAKSFLVEMPQATHTEAVGIHIALNRQTEEERPCRPPTIDPHFFVNYNNLKSPDSLLPTPGEHRQLAPKSKALRLLCLQVLVHSAISMQLQKNKTTH